MKRIYEKFALAILVLTGKTQTIGGQTIRVLERDSNGLIVRASGTAAASTQNSLAVYAKDARYFKTDASTGQTGEYRNTGTSASSSFTLLEGAESTITGVTADYGLLGSATEGTATLSLGLAVRNESGSTITKGSLVRVSGLSSGAIPLITLADSDGGTGFQAQYVATADIANNANGNVYRVALVTGLNTNSFTSVGDPVYLSGTAGAFTQTAPAGDIQCTQRVGIVITKNATTGSILFDIRHPEKLGSNELQDKAITVSKLAANPTVAGQTQESPEVVITRDWTNTDPDGSNDIAIYSANSPALEILDVIMDMTTAEGGAMTATLRTAAAGGGSAISSALDVNATTMQRTTSLASQALTTNSSLFLNFSGNPGTAVGRLIIRARRTA